MKLTRFLVIATCVLCFVLYTAFLIRPTATLQLASMFSFLTMAVALAASMVYAIKGWRTLGIRSVYLLVACLIVIPAAEKFGVFGRQAYFENILLPDFREVVANVDKSEVANAEPPVILRSKHAYLAWAEVAENGRLHVIFFTGGGCPVRHSGYLYVDGSDIDHTAKILQSWKKPQNVMDSWYRISD